MAVHRGMVDKGVGVAVAGGAIGAIAGIVAVAGTTAAALTAVFGAPTGNLEDVGFWLFVGLAWMVGGYAGLVLGCRYALRRGGYDKASDTARWSFIFASCGWLLSGPTSALGESFGLSVVAVGFATYFVALVASPALARLYVCRPRRRPREIS